MNNEDFIVPAYQRAFTWEDDRRSRFIESLLMGLPIPFLFFWESPDTGKLEIVDGSQRLRTIQQFIGNTLKLQDLEQLPTLDGFRFRDLPESRQRKVKNRSIRGIVLNEHADEQARFELFDRINTGSKVANKAELRRGALGGDFMNLIIELAVEPEFVNLAPLSEKLENERYREELVTRFFAYGDGLEGYRDRVSDFLYAYTKRMNSDASNKLVDLSVYRTRFVRTMAFVARNFPNGFRRGAGGTTTPRARFESIAIGSALAIREQPALAEAIVDISEWIDGETFREITGSDGANAVNRLRGRINYVRDRLLRP